MNLTISGHHLDVSPALRQYVLDKMDRVNRHFDQVVDVNVLLSVENRREKERRQKAEVILHVKGREIFVEHAHEDLYAAIDQLVDKLDRQVCRHKDRVQAHHHESAKRMVLDGDVGGDTDGADATDPTDSGIATAVAGAGDAAPRQASR